MLRFLIGFFPTIFVLTFATQALSQAYYYTGLQIYAPGIKDSLITSLTLNTNQDTMLQVLGRRSDNSMWEPTSANWLLSPSVTSVMTAGSNLRSFKISPTDTANGWIRVSLGDDAKTAPDTIRVRFLPGPPVAVQMVVTTQADQRIAGHPIIANLTVNNADNKPVIGNWCCLATFSDQAGNGSVLQSPLAIISSGGAWYDTVQINNPNDSVMVCFSGGNAGVQFLLYNAFLYQMHRIKVVLNSVTLGTFSDSFPLLPGPLAHLSIEDYSGAKFSDTVHLSHNGDVLTAYARGYDQYGNYRGEALSDWTNNGTLHPISSSSNVSHIAFDPTVASGDESGSITATAVGTNISDRLFVVIAGNDPVINPLGTGYKIGDQSFRVVVYDLRGKLLSKSTCKDVQALDSQLASKLSGGAYFYSVNNGVFKKTLNRSHVR